MTTPLLEVRHLVKHFVRKQGLFRAPSVVRAVDDVTFAIDEGEMFGLVGESGSGKSTTGRCILRLIEPTSGGVLFRGEELLPLARARRRDSVKEPLIIHRRGDRAERQARVAELFDLVGLERTHLTRYPHEFSG